MGSAYDNVQVEALTARGIPLGWSATSTRLAVAEHALFLMLAWASRRAVEHDRAVRNGGWAVAQPVRGRRTFFFCRGRTLLLMGFGRIGREVAARGHGPSAAASSPTTRWFPADRIAAAGRRTDVRLARRASRPDIVSLHLPKTPETTHLIGPETLGTMKSGAVVINTRPRPA